jgi:hypothetical protein
MSTGDLPAVLSGALTAEPEGRTASTSPLDPGDTSLDARWRRAAHAAGLDPLQPGMVTTEGHIIVRPEMVQEAHHHFLHPWVRLWRNRDSGWGGLANQVDTVSPGEAQRLRLDFEHPATLGCLLASARKAWRDPGLAALGKHGLDGLLGVEVKGDPVHGATWARLGLYDTDAEALIAAIEAAAARKGGGR